MQQTINQYAWKLAGLAKGIDIDAAVQELERIESLYGSLTPENVLDASRPKHAVLHDAFEWDDNIAAEHHRLQQARVLLNNIEVKIISNGLPRVIPVYEVIKQPNNPSQYKSIQSMTSSDITFIKQRTKKELTILKDKLSVYKELEKTCSFLVNALDSLD